MDRSATRTALLALTTSAVLFGVGCMSDVVDPDDSGEDTAALEAGARGLAGQQGQVSQTPQHKADQGQKAQPRPLAPTQGKAGAGENVGQAGQKLDSQYPYPYPPYTYPYPYPPYAYPYPPPPYAYPYPYPPYGYPYPYPYYGHRRYYGYPHRHFFGHGRWR